MSVNQGSPLFQLRTSVGPDFVKIHFVDRAENIRQIHSDISFTENCKVNVK